MPMNPRRPASLAGPFLAALSLMGCNAITGLNQFSVDADPGSHQDEPDGSDDSQGGEQPDGDVGDASADAWNPVDGPDQEGGEPSNDGGSDAPDAPPPECLTNQECTDRL